MKLNTRTILPNGSALLTHVTHEGAPAKRIPDFLTLRRSVLSCMLWEDTFYEDGVSIAERIRTLTLSADPAQAAALAIEARSAMKLRHAPLWIARALASGTPAQKAVVADTLATIIQRPDELTEFLAMYWKDGRTPIAACIKRGLARAFQKFNPYQLAKYNREGTVRLRDVLFLTHPKPKDDEQAATWKDLAAGTLAAPDTWEVALSAGADKKETFERLIVEEKLGALALLRNLRNMEQAGVSDAMIRSALANCQPDRVLPFRFVSAARHAPRFEPELERLMFKCLEGRPKLPGKTILLVDGSGSMFGPKISAKSDLERFDAACALAVLLREQCEEVEIAQFSHEYRIVAPRRGFALRDALHQTAERSGTMTEGAKLVADDRGYDRLIIITDEQSHQALSNPRARGYVINVGTYKNGVGYGKWTHIDGWSEAVIDFVQQAETPPQ